MGKVLVPRWRPLGVLAICLPLGCSDAGDAGKPLGAASQEIIDGTIQESGEWPEGVLIHMLKGDGKAVGGCTGVALSKRIVLTAGHCITGLHSEAEGNTPKSWQVLSPKTKTADEKVVSTTEVAKLIDWEKKDSGDWEKKYNGHYDVGILCLPKDQPYTIDKYPVLSTDPLEKDANKVTVVGRVKGTDIKHLVAAEQKLYKLKLEGKDYFPQGYGGLPHVMEAGDSGGFTVLLGSSPHKIITVHTAHNEVVISGKGTWVDFGVRVDENPVKDWIAGFLSDTAKKCGDKEGSTTSSSSGATGGDGGAGAGEASGGGGMSASGGMGGLGGMSGSGATTSFGGMDGSGGANSGVGGTPGSGGSPGFGGMPGWGAMGGMPGAGASAGWDGGGGEPVLVLVGGGGLGGSGAGLGGGEPILEITGSGGGTWGVGGAPWSGSGGASTGTLVGGASGVGGASTSTLVGGASGIGGGDAQCPPAGAGGGLVCTSVE